MWDAIFIYAILYVNLEFKKLHIQGHILHFDRVKSETLFVASRTAHWILPPKFFGETKINSSVWRNIDSLFLIFHLCFCFMDLLIRYPLSKTPPALFPFNSGNTIQYPAVRCLNFELRNFQVKSLVSRQNRRIRAHISNERANDDGFLLEDVPHLTHFLPDLPVVNDASCSYPFW